MNTWIGGRASEVDATNNVMEKGKGSCEDNSCVGVQLACDTWHIFADGSCRPRLSPNVFAGDAADMLANAIMSRPQLHPVLLTNAASVQDGCISTTHLCTERIAQRWLAGI